MSWDIGNSAISVLHWGSRFGRAKNPAVAHLLKLLFFWKEYFRGLQD